MKRSHILVITFFATISSLFSQGSVERLTSGMANLQLNKFSEAVEDFSDCLLDGTDNLSAYMGRAEAYYNLSEWENAISDFKHAELVSPGSGNLGLARIYAQLGNASMAVTYLEKHLRSDQRVPEKRIMLDSAFEPIERSSEWRTLWRNDWYSDKEQIVREIEYLIGQESYSEALNILDDEITQEPENGNFYHLRARIYSAQNENRKALTNCDIALRYNKDKLECLITKSVILVELKRYEEALKPMNRAIYLNPVQLELYPKRAIIHDKAGNFSSAIEDLNHYLKFIDSDKEVLFLTGQIYQKMGKLYPALKSFNKLIELDQSNPLYFISRGKAYYETGTYRYAISDFGMALDLDPSNPDTYLYRGKVYLSISDIEHACYDLDKASERGSKEAIDLIYKNCR